MKRNKLLATGAAIALTAQLSLEASLPEGATVQTNPQIDAIVIVPNCRRDAVPKNAVFRKSGIALPFPSAHLDLSPYTETTGSALLRCRVNVDKEGDYFLGIGADWWHISWLDGKVAVDRDALGNGSHPPKYTDHLFPVHLSAGKHTLDVRFTKGDASAVLSITFLPQDVKKYLEAERKIKQQQRRYVLDIFRQKQAYMDARIKSGIEAGRKGSFYFTIVDQNNVPVPNARVKVKQLTHDFKYGANLFMLEEFSKEEQNQAYRKYFKEAFNYATLPFYWCDLEPQQGKPRFAKDSPKIYRRPAPDLCLEFCEANGIEPKAHCLNYAVYEPQWAKGSIDWEKQCLRKRFTELAERYSRRIPAWEVTNETFQSEQGANQAKLSNFYRQPDLIEWSFREAERCFPANTLIINEMQNRIWSDESFRRDRSLYFMQIERALLKGCRIDEIGMQYHMFFSREKEIKETKQYYDPERIYDVLDWYARLGKPIQITELTIPAYSNEPEDEAIQAQILKNLYSMWFSHPAVSGIVYWNLVDGFAGGAEQGDMTAGENRYYGGLIRYDFTPKPAYQVVRDLFQKEWHTETECTTDDSGSAQFRGFYGKYAVEITINGKTVTREIHFSKALLKHRTIQL